jgi:hypothetical protein
MHVAVLMVCRSCSALLHYALSSAAQGLGRTQEAEQLACSGVCCYIQVRSWWAWKAPRVWSALQQPAGVRGSNHGHHISRRVEGTQAASSQPGYMRAWALGHAPRALHTYTMSAGGSLLPQQP